MLNHKRLKTRPNVIKTGSKPSTPVYTPQKLLNKSRQQHKRSTTLQNNQYSHKSKKKSSNGPKTMVNLTNAPQLLGGLLPIYKPRGVTSTDLSNYVRSLLSKIHPALRFGFAGTLDENATGVFVGAVGSATPFLRYVLPHDKTYIARLKLGIETDSCDVLGNQIDTKPLPLADITKEKIQQIIDTQFSGEISQVPPAFSSLKINGERASLLARQGKQIQMAPRRVVIHDCQVLDYNGEYLDIKVHCGKGTYIRSLAIDIANAIGTTCHLTQLTRTQVGLATTDEFDHNDDNGNDNNDDNDQYHDNNDNNGDFGLEKEKSNHHHHPNTTSNKTTTHPHQSQHSKNTRRIPPPLIDNYSELIQRYNVYAGTDPIANKILDSQKNYGIYLPIADTYFSPDQVALADTVNKRFNFLKSLPNGGFDPQKRFKTITIEELMNDTDGQVILNNLIPPHYVANYSQYFDTWDEEFNPSLTEGQTDRHHMIDTNNSNNNNNNNDGDDTAIIIKSVQAPAVKAKQITGLLPSGHKASNINGDYIDYLGYTYESPKITPQLDPNTDQFVPPKSKYDPENTSLIDKFKKQSDHTHTNYIEYHSPLRYLMDYTNASRYTSIHKHVNEYYFDLHMSWFDALRPDIFPTQALKDMRHLLQKLRLSHNPLTNFLSFGIFADYSIQNQSDPLSPLTTPTWYQHHLNTDKILPIYAPNIQYKADHPIMLLGGQYPFIMHRPLRQPYSFFKDVSISPSNNHYISPSSNDISLVLAESQRNVQNSQLPIDEMMEKQQKLNKSSDSTDTIDTTTSKSSPQHRIFQSTKPLNNTQASSSSMSKIGHVDIDNHEHLDGEISKLETQLFELSKSSIQDTLHYTNPIPTTSTNPITPSSSGTIDNTDYNILSGTPYHLLPQVYPMTPNQRVAHKKYFSRVENLLNERLDLSAPNEYLELWDSISRSRANVLNIPQTYLRTWQRRVPLIYYDSRILFLQRYSNEHRIKSSPVVNAAHESIKKWRPWSRLTRDMQGNLLDFDRKGRLINMFDLTPNPKRPLILKNGGRSRDPDEDELLYKPNPKLNSKYNRDSYVSDELTNYIDEYKFISLGPKQYEKERQKKLRYSNPSTQQTQLFDQIPVQLTNQNDTDGIELDPTLPQSLRYQQQRQFHLQQQLIQNIDKPHINVPSVNSPTQLTIPTSPAPRRIMTFHEKRMYIKRLKVEHSKLLRRLSLETTMLEQLTQHYLTQRQSIYHQRDVLLGEMKSLQNQYTKLNQKVKKTTDIQSILYENSRLKEQIRSREEQLLLLTDRLQTQPNSSNITINTGSTKSMSGGGMTTKQPLLDPIDFSATENHDNDNDFVLSGHNDGSEYDKYLSSLSIGDSDEQLTPPHYHQSRDDKTNRQQHHYSNSPSLDNPKPQLFLAKDQYHVQSLSPLSHGEQFSLSDLNLSDDQYNTYMSSSETGELPSQNFTNSSSYDPFGVSSPTPTTSQNTKAKSKPSTFQSNTSFNLHETSDDYIHAAPASNKNTVKTKGRASQHKDNHLQHFNKNDSHNSFYSHSAGPYQSKSFEFDESSDEAIPSQNNDR